MLWDEYSQQRRCKKGWKSSRLYQLVQLFLRFFRNRFLACVVLID